MSRRLDGLENHNENQRRQGAMPGISGLLRNSLIAIATIISGCAKDEVHEKAQGIEHVIRDEKSIFPSLPNDLQKNVIYEHEPKNVKKRLIAILHVHGSALTFRDDMLRTHIQHQAEVFSDLQRMVQHYGYDRVSFFLEGLKGPISHWNDETISAQAQSWKKLRTWQESDKAKQDELVKEFQHRLNSSELTSANTIWNEYDGPSAFTGFCKTLHRMPAIYGAEPPKRIEWMPDLSDNKLTLDEITDRLKKAQEMMHENVRVRNKHTAALMDRMVLEKGIGVLTMGAGHFAAAQERYELASTADVTTSLEKFLTAIPRAHLIVIQPTKVPSLLKHRKKS